VVSFDATTDGASGVNKMLLNNLACAGHTAVDFDKACVESPSGGYRAADPSGPVLYRRPKDQGALVQELSTLLGGVCCGCVPS
jgi:hypothetical protein